MSTSSSHIIMMYNVENLFDTFDDPYTNDDDFLPEAPKKWNNKRFRHKLNQLTDVILSIDKEPASLIGVVEVENAYVLDQLVNNAYLRRFNYKHVHFNSPDERGIDVALIYDDDKFEVLAKEAIPVFLREGDKTRDILYVKGRFKGEEEDFHIFVNHWPSRREGEKISESKRIIAAETLRYNVSKIFDEESSPNIIIMGDFNDYPTNTSMIDYLKAQENSVISASELFNMAYKLHQKGKGSYNYRGDWVMMDQIIVSGNLLDENNGAYYVVADGLDVMDEEWILHYDKRFDDYKPDKTYGGDNYHGGYSDHLPIYMKLNKSY